MTLFHFAMMVSAILTLISFKSAKADDVDTATKYSDLVQQLVSPNTAPERGSRGGEPWVKFSKDYDVAAQRRVGEARTQLHDNIQEALPYLVEALDDKRYCMTVSIGEGDSFPNQSVGATCREVIASHLEVYREKIRFSAPQQWNHYSYTPISKEWWAQRKDLSLVDLQIEAIDWAIDRITADTKTTKPPEEREAEIEALKLLRDDLKTSNVPAKALRLLPMKTSSVP
jgi:hypothetical protein